MNPALQVYSICKELFLSSLARDIDLLQVPLEDTQHKFKIVGINSGSDVWPRICRLARGTCTLPVLMNN